MPFHAGLRLPLVLVFLVLLLLPVSCSTPFSTGLGGDPCLLAQYQSHSYSIIGHLNGDLDKLVSHVDALQEANNFAVSASQDISDTLFFIATFSAQLDEQTNILKASAQPPEGDAFVQHTRQATARMRTMALMLTTAYLDEANGNTRTAKDVAAQARAYYYAGRNLLQQDYTDLSVLKTYSPNC